MVKTVVKIAFFSFILMSHGDRIFIHNQSRFEKLETLRHNGKPLPIKMDAENGIQVSVPLEFEQTFKKYFKSEGYNCRTTHIFDKSPVKTALVQF